MAEGRLVMSEMIAQLRAKHPPVGLVPLTIGDCRIDMESNSASLLALMRDYFRHVLGDGGKAHFRITMIEAPAPDFEVSLRYWPRDEPLPEEETEDEDRRRPPKRHRPPSLPMARR